MLMPTWLLGRRSVTTESSATIAAIVRSAEIRSGAGQRWRRARDGDRAREHGTCPGIERHDVRRSLGGGARRVVHRQLVDPRRVSQVATAVRPWGAARRLW